MWWSPGASQLRGSENTCEEVLPLTQQAGSRFRETGSSCGHVQSHHRGCRARRGPVLNPKTLRRMVPSSAAPWTLWLQNCMHLCPSPGLFWLGTLGEAEVTSLGWRGTRREGRHRDSRHDCALSTEGARTGALRSWPLCLSLRSWGLPDPEDTKQGVFWIMVAGRSVRLMPVLGNLRPGWPGPPHSTPPPIVRELLRLGDFKFFIKC